MSVAIGPRSARTRQNNSSRPTPPDLVLKDSAIHRPSLSRTISNSNSSSSLNSAPSQKQQQYSYPFPYQHQHVTLQGQEHQNPESQNGGTGVAATTGVGVGMTQLLSYNAHYPSYRPYTPTTPTMPITPTLAASGGSLLPFPKNHQHQRVSSTRRIPSYESSLYDPYRSRQPGVSANRVKNDYHAQSPMREGHSTFPSAPPSQYSGHGSSEEVHEIRSQSGGDTLSINDQGSMIIMPPPPAVGQREDHHRHSPTLAASQILLAASYSARPESPAYLPYQPYSNQPLPSPSIMDAYRSSAAYSSPGLGPLPTGFPFEEQRERSSDYGSSNKADPYRSAYSQQHHYHPHHNSSHLSNQSNCSPYLGSGTGSPNPNEDFSSSFDSRFSGTSHQQLQPQQQNNNNNSQQYSTRDLAGQGSTQALSATGLDTNNVKRQQRNIKSSEVVEAAQPLGNDIPMMAMGSNNLSTGTEDKPQSTTQLSQFSKTDSSGKTKKAPSKIEEEENDVILQKLGVISATDNNGTRSKGSRSGISYGSGRSRGRRSQWADESGDEYGHNHKGRRLDRIRRGHEAQRCCCCTTRTCVFLTFALLISFALALYFLVPRTPYFAFESVTPNGPPVITKDRIREPFAIQILIDSKSNYVPIRIDAIEMTVWLQYNRTKIADNDDMASSFVIQPRVDQVISIPMILNYRSYRMDISTDKVLQELVEACTYVDLDSLDEGVMVPGINLIVGGRLHIWGLSWIWKPTFSFDADNVPCPVNSRDRPAGISPGGDPGNPSTSSIVRPVPVPSATAMMTSIV